MVRGVKEATGDIVQGSYRKRVPHSPVKEIADISDDINLLTEELRRLAELRRKWLAETSHELRTPLAAMTAEMDALADGVRPYGPEAMASLKEEAHSLGRLVNDLHFLAVADLSAPAYHFSVLDPVALCEGVVGRFRSMAESRVLTIALSVDVENAVTAKWDKGRIEQLLSNLLSNSVRYTDAPGDIQLKPPLSSTEASMSRSDTSTGINLLERWMLWL